MNPLDQPSFLIEHQNNFLTRDKESNRSPGLILYGYFLAQVLWLGTNEKQAQSNLGYLLFFVSNAVILAVGLIGTVGRSQCGRDVH